MGTEERPDPGGLDVALRLAHQLRDELPPPKPKRKYAPRQKRTSGDPEPVGEVLGKVVEEQGWGTEISLRMMLSRWSELVGATNALHSKPEGFHEGVLYVRTESTTWATALRAIAPQLLAKLNESLGQGAVTRIEIKGPAAPSWKHGPLSVRDGRGPRDTYG
jgi:predicted nucleic acid-binding Zn ribbon protein